MKSSAQKTPPLPVTATQSVRTDICLILEGTYPYVSGGVSTWTHELLQAHSDLSFHLVCILPPDDKMKRCYDVPDNVKSVQHIFLQKVPEGARFLPSQKRRLLFSILEEPLRDLYESPSLEHLEQLLEILQSPEFPPLGSNILLDSHDAWEMLEHMYRTSMPDSCFLDYFWSWRALFSGIYSVMLAEMPQAKMYHTLCTGYAGLMLARAKIETGRPCIITEHGIYTNERRIEISSADWLDNPQAQNLNVIAGRQRQKNLRSFWIDTFVGFSRMCYQSCIRTITLYEGNKEFQVEDGADENKIVVIPNGIDYEHFSSIERIEHKIPTFALIGRVVPIKDIKTYIKACRILADMMPEFRAYVMGPGDEDEEYYDECVKMVENMGLKNKVVFTGKVNLKDYLGGIDVQVLTSISEAQPLVILEAGAAGIPSVTTDVGACREMIYGRSDEEPQLHPGGEVCPLSNPRAIANAVHRLLTDRDYYDKCSEAMQERVKTYYNKKDLQRSYHDLYDIFSNINERA